MIIPYREKESIESIESMLSVSKNPYLALSFGKDSLVMLDLVLKFKADITCLFLKSSESYLMYNFEDLIKFYTDNFQINLHIIETDRLNEFDSWQSARKAGNKDFEKFDELGFDGVFMGLRKEESKARRITLSLKANNEIGKFLMKYKNQNKYRCCPLANWRTEEIRFYLKERNLPILDVYQEGDHIRTTARLTGDSVRANNLFWIKKNKPENYNKLLKLIPELGGIH